MDIITASDAAIKIRKSFLLVILDQSVLSRRDNLRKGASLRPFIICCH